MRLYLIRHGDALPGFDDAARPLSEAGLREADLAGAFLRQVGASPDVVYHSRLLRAKQTAEGVAARLGASGRLEVCSGVRPGDSAKAFVHILDVLNIPPGGEAIVVTHQPFVSGLASCLLTGSENVAVLKFSTGTVSAFERQGRGLWTLRFHMTAKAIARLLENETEEADERFS